MICDACGASNDADARFCEDCGAPQSRRCPGCDITVRPNARFCKGCGASLDENSAGASERRATRKTVTVIFADLGGSTSFEERVDPETARSVLGRYHATLGSIAEELGAGTVKFLGDGVMAVWGVPEIAADDADRAVRAGIAMQSAFESIAADVAQRFDAEISLRVAINTGEVVVGDDDADIVGDALNVAARLEKECPASQVVVGDETWRATRGDHDYESRGEVEVAGREEPVGVHLLRGAAVLDTTLPFVGRDHEADEIRRVFDAAVRNRELRLVSVVGEPGVGKTTLSRELTDDLDASVVAFSCTADSATALGPIVEVLRTIVDDQGAQDLGRLVPDDVGDRERILDVVNDLTAGGAGHTVEETFRSLRRLVEITAAAEPFVMVIDDIQWADPVLLDFIEHLVEWVRDSPVLVIALARPEIREVRPTLAEASRWVDVAINLEGLDAEATRRLAAQLLGSDDVPEELAGRLPASTRGNPLFVRELVRMLVHDGVLEQRGDAWHLTIDADAIDIPPTVKSLLATRIERLPDDERRLIEVAAVIGTDFDLGAVAKLSGRPRSAVLTHAERLRRLQLVEPAGAYAGDDPVWRFHHVLIRDVAYRRLLKADRADLHEQLADHRAARGGADVDEVVARHLDAAHRYRDELGDRSAHVADLGVRAASRYLTAAQRALDRDELTSAGSLAAGGIDLAGGDRGLAADLAMLACEAHLAALDAAAGATMVARLAEIIADETEPWLVCFQAQVAVLTDPDSLPMAEADLSRAIDEFAAAGDGPGLAKAHLVRARTRARLGRVADCEADLDQALVAAREADDRRRVTAVLGAAPTAALWGPSPVPRAGGRCLDVIRLQRITTAAPSVEATSVRCQAVLEALRGRTDNARSMIAAAHRTVSDLGLRHGQAETELFEGIIETIAGDPAAAEPHFRAALDGLGSLGVGADAGQAAALLAKSLLSQGRLDDADRYASESEKLAGQNLKTAIAWRAARAEILSAQGRADEAVTLAREAVDIGAGTDIVLDHADACLTLSRVLAAAGDVDGATQARSEADRLHEAKGAEAMLSAAHVTKPPSPTPVDEASTAVDDQPRVDNRAARAVEAAIERLRRGDPDLASAFVESFIRVDHREVLSAPVQDRAAFVENLRELYAMTGNVTITPVAVRGERVVLFGVVWTEDDGFEIRLLAVGEIDAAGDITSVATFDADDQRGAYAMLDALYQAGEAAEHAVTVRHSVVGEVATAKAGKPSAKP